MAELTLQLALRCRIVAVAEGVASAFEKAIATQRSGRCIHIRQVKKMANEMWKDRLQARLLETQHSMKSLSLAAGLGETGVRDMLKRTQSPSIDAMAKVAKELDMSLTELWEGPPRMSFAQSPS